MPELRIENLVKKFGKKVVLNDVSFTVPSASFTCLIGPAGAGKTTLLSIIAGIETPTSGKIYIDGKDVTNWPPKRRNIAMVFQDFGLYPHFSVFDNIAFPLKIRKVPREEIDRKVKEVASFLQIDNLLDRMPDEISGGEKQRVAIARALIRKTKIVLFDEIESNIDYKIREQMRTELKKWKDEIGLTVLYATPDPETASAVADKLVVINNGRIFAEGDPMTIYNTPPNVFTATFATLPSMNIIEGKLSAEQGEVLVKTSMFDIPIRRDFDRLKRYLGKEVYIGIKPSDVALVIEGEKAPSGPGIIRSTGMILVEEVLGSETIVHLDLQGVKMKALVPKILRGFVGKEIPVLFDARKIYLYDKSSGTLILSGGMR